MFLQCTISHYSTLLKGMENCLGEIETVWLAGGQKQFLAGDAISVRRIFQPSWCRGLLELCRTSSRRIASRRSSATLLSLSIISLQIADIMAATELEQPSMAGYDVTAGRYKVNSEKTKNKFSTPQNYPGRVNSEKQKTSLDYFQPSELSLASTCPE